MPEALAVMSAISKFSDKKVSSKTILSISRNRIKPGTANKNKRKINVAGFRGILNFKFKNFTAGWIISEINQAKINGSTQWIKYLKNTKKPATINAAVRIIFAIFNILLLPLLFPWILFIRSPFPIHKL
jgi:hypothetical protein